MNVYSKRLDLSMREPCSLPGYKRQLYYLMTVFPQASNLSMPQFPQLLSKKCVSKTIISMPIQALCANFKRYFPLPIKVEKSISLPPQNISSPMSVTVVSICLCGIKNISSLIRGNFLPQLYIRALTTLVGHLVQRTTRKSYTIALKIST